MKKKIVGLIISTILIIGQGATIPIWATDFDTEQSDSGAGQADDESIITGSLPTDPDAYLIADSATRAISADTIRALYRVKIEQKAEREEVAKVTGTNKDESAVRAPKKRENKKIYPNDPCPCGSGKKYKQCCGRKLMKA